MPFSGSEGVMSEERKVSPVEVVKENSRFLRGPVGEELTDGNACFGKDSEVLLKFHGTYQQDDRDARLAAENRRRGREGVHFHGAHEDPWRKLTSDQLLAELDLADELGNTTLRCTTRQGLQLHGVTKSNLRDGHPPHQRCATYHARRLRRRESQCHVLPRAVRPAVSTAQTQQLADAIAAHLAPRSSSYHDIWLTDVSTGEKQLVGGGDPAWV